MAGLKSLKLKRQSINKTRKVTRAMEAVSAVKMRKAQERALGGRAYATGALRVLSHLSDSVDMSGHDLFAKKGKGKVGILVITSDKGLAGSLNSAVVKKVEEFVSQHKEVTFVCVGRRGNEFVTNRGLNVLHYQENKSDSVTEADMQAVTNVILEAHEKGETKEWYIAYTNFKSTFEQDAVMRQVLPLSKETLEEVVSGITPEHGKYAEETEETKSFAYTIEPSADAILDVVIPSLTNIVVYHALLETKASEHSARMVAMKNATDKAGELSHELMLKFNKARQAVITREVSEITSGIEAMK